MTRSHSLVADAGDLFIENAEKPKFCFLKNRKEQLRTPCLAYHCDENRWADMPAVGSGEKENAANQTRNVMNKRGHVFELRVQDKWAHHNRGEEFANYLRENSGVKGYGLGATDSRPLTTDPAHYRSSITDSYRPLPESSL